MANTARLNVIISDKADNFLKEFPLKKKFKQAQVTSYIEAFGNQFNFATKCIKEIFSDEDIKEISNSIEFDCYSPNYSSKQFFKSGFENLYFLGDTKFLDIKSTKQPDKTLVSIIDELTEFYAFVLILECFKSINSPYNTTSEETSISTEDLKNKYNK